ncbi:hypothetical protein EMIHUDRAFT_200323 [Emiliania huxleyi CCMP1516]|uniref:Agenet-like domain-containing protein n=2 Tax=Emiliania huxleyi TaxID=2903 RepID=A0A0D3KVD7_EMIH1|nr:hypothetical protein EMIHUDRAFT_200323 [Emiliania huxleyi CCMP1516]EOD39722.1 hypothetical protein EMIHUDRAFT_200323 [Emiliania huxleyi CCMP1516]|eukprot:XP_005792151.1 hypothetical protein EMIHUDRAFT_200323 [Emiliania huxleyi CCMP1516]
MDIFVGGTPVNETIASLFSCDASPPPADEDSRVSIFSVIYTLIVFVVKLCRAAAFALLSIMYTLVACLVDMLRALVFTLFSLAFDIACTLVSLAFDIACTLVSLAFDITCTLVPCLVDLFRAAAVAFSGKAADDSSYLGIAHCGLASRREYRDTFRPWPGGPHGGRQLIRSLLKHKWLTPLAFVCAIYAPPLLAIVVPTYALVIDLARLVLWLARLGIDLAHLVLWLGMLLLRTTVGIIIAVRFLPLLLASSYCTASFLPRLPAWAVPASLDVAASFAFAYFAGWLLHRRIPKLAMPLLVQVLGVLGGVAAEDGEASAAAGASALATAGWVLGSLHSVLASGSSGASASSSSGASASSSSGASASSGGSVRGGAARHVAKRRERWAAAEAAKVLAACASQDDVVNAIKAGKKGTTVPEAMKQGLPLYHITPTAVDRPGWTLPAFSRDEIPLFERRGRRTFLEPLSPSKAGVDRSRLGSNLDHEDKRVWVAGSLEDALLKVRRREGKKHDLSRASPAYTIVMIFPSHPLYRTFDNALTTACANLGEGGSSLHPILIDDLGAGQPVLGIGLVELSMAGGATARPWMVDAMTDAVEDAVGATGLTGCYFHVSPHTLDGVRERWWHWGRSRAFNKRPNGETYIEADTLSHVDAAARALGSSSLNHDPTFGWWSTSLSRALKHVVSRERNANVSKYTVAIIFPAHVMHETFDNFYSAIYANLGFEGIVTIHPVLIDAPKGAIDGLIVLEVTLPSDVEPTSTATVRRSRPCVGVAWRRGFGSFDAWFGGPGGLLDGLRATLAPESVAALEPSIEAATTTHPLLFHVVPKRWADLNPSDRLEARSLRSPEIEAMLFEGKAPHGNVQRLLWVGKALRGVLLHVMRSGPPPEAWTVVAIDPTHPDFFKSKSAWGGNGRFRTSRSPLRLGSSGLLVFEVTRAAGRGDGGAPRLRVEVMVERLASVDDVNAALEKQRTEASAGSLGLSDDQYARMVERSKDGKGGSTLEQWLLDADFRDALLGLGNLLGGPDMLPEVMCNTLPAHLLEPRFLDAVIELAEEAGGIDTLPKLMCSGLASNLLKPGFADAALDLAERAGGIDTLPQMMCDGLAANLLKPGFADAALDLAERAGGVDQLPGMMCGGLAARLSNTDFTDDLHAILDIAERLDSASAGASRKRKRTDIDASYTLMRLVHRDSPFFDYMSSIRERLEGLGNDEECRECLRGLAGERSKKRETVKQWGLVSSNYLSMHRQSEAAEGGGGAGKRKAAGGASGGGKRAKPQWAVGQLVEVQGDCGYKGSWWPAKIREIAPPPKQSATVVYSYNGTDLDTVAKRRLRPAPEVAPPLAEKDLGVGSELEFFWKDEAWWEITVTGIRCDGAIRVLCCSGANEYKHLIERGDVARLLRRRTA